MLTGYQSWVRIPSPVTSAFTNAYDGAYGVLGSARLMTDTTKAGFVYATANKPKIDSADINRMESESTLYPVIMHGMAQVMEFGTLWNGNHVSVNESGRFTGAPYACALPGRV